MAQYIHAAAAPNRALTAALLNSSNILTGTSSSDSEINIVGLTSKSGLYRFTFSSAIAAGTYRMVIVDDVLSTGVAVYEAKFSGVAEEVVQATEFVPSSADLAALEANQLAIISKITPITTVYTTQPSSSVIELVKGDSYDGIANSKLSWTTSKNIDSTQELNFTIRDLDDNLILDQDTAGVSVTGSGTLFEVSLSAAATNLLSQLKRYVFDCEVVFITDSHWTFTRGSVVVVKDQSR